MKKLVFLLAALCLLTVGALAQAKPTDYSGEWSLDKAKSTLSDRMKNVESMTMTVTQTDKELKVATATKRGIAQGVGASPGGAPPAGAPPAGGPPPGGGGGGGMGRGMGGGMGDQTLTYTLDGKETSTEIPSDRGASTLKTTAKVGAGQLELTSSRTFNSPMGEVKVTTKETWELGSDGSLKVKRDSESPRGTESNVFVFTKKAK